MRPSLTLRCVADQHANRPRERIAEFSFPDASDGRGSLPGGLIALRYRDGGRRPVVEVYRVEGCDVVGPPAEVAKAGNGETWTAEQWAAWLHRGPSDPRPDWRGLCDASRALLPELQRLRALESLVAEMLDYEAEQFDGESTFDVWEMHPGFDRKIRDGLTHEERAEFERTTPPKDGISYRFEELESGDLDVSGADLVDAFSGWRSRLRAALNGEA